MINIYMYRAENGINTEREYRADEQAVKESSGRETTGAFNVSLVQY